MKRVEEENEAHSIKLEADDPSSREGKIKICNKIYICFLNMK